MLRPGDLIQWTTREYDKNKGFRRVFRVGIIRHTGRSHPCANGTIEVQGHIIERNQVVKVIKKQKIPANVVLRYL